MILRTWIYFLNFAFTPFCTNHKLKGLKELFKIEETIIFYLSISFQMFLNFVISCRGGSPPGLSIAQANRVAGKVPLKGDMLLKRKVS